jgi:hypothetical protein
MARVLWSVAKRQAGQWTLGRRSRARRFLAIARGRPSLDLEEKCFLDSHCQKLH